MSNDAEAKKALDVILFDLFQTLTLYGKEPEALESMSRIFKMILSEYRFEDIKKAFVYYLKYFKGMPEPSDIVTIIERGGKPPFERSVYISIQKKPAEERSSDEWSYVKDYEMFIVNGKYD